MYFNLYDTIQYCVYLYFEMIYDVHAKDIVNFHIAKPHILDIKNIKDLYNDYTTFIACPNPFEICECNLDTMRMIKKLGGIIQ